MNGTMQVEELRFWVNSPYIGNITSSFSIMTGMMRAFMQAFSSADGLRLSFLSDGNMLSSMDFCGDEGGVYDGSDQGGM